MGPARIGLIAALLLLLLGSAATVATPGSAAEPGCADPVTSGDTIVGTPCGDTIVVPPGIESVQGGGGDDTIVAAPVTASFECTGECEHLGVGSQTFNGGPGNDLIFGERGNDTLNGGEGGDRLYGGIGDDRLRGGPGSDLLSGGFGADTIDGEEGDDLVRGDATLDRISDSGGGTDTLSFATGVTPGFPNNPGQGYPNFAEFTGFPAVGGERGVYLDLEAGKGSIADNGVAPDGGGVDGGQGENTELRATDFEKLVGTAFSDFIVGSGQGETIYGGGGADVILGEGGDDVLHGGADGDHLDGGPGQDAVDGGAGTDSCEGYEPASPNPCEASGKAVAPRDTSKVAVGLMAPQEGGAAGLYLTGSASGNDDVTAAYSATPSPRVAFSLAAGSFEDPSAEGSCTAGGGTAVCTLAEAPDSVVLAGMGGADTIDATGFPDSTSIVVLGGDDGDSLTGGDGENEDVLADGPGNDQLAALAGDDALLNTEGTDTLDGGRGSDLLLSDSVCDGDLVNGGEGDYRDNASWTKLKTPVAARLDSGEVGRPVGGQPSCAAGGSLDHLQTIEDLEGSGQGDFFYGDAANNQLLGHRGADTYFALGGADTILANSEDSDLVIDCGDDADTAFIDRPTATYADPLPVNCERVFEADPNDFQPPGTPTGPEPPVTAPTPVPKAVTGKRPPRGQRDTTPPQTRLLRRPGKTVFAVGRRRTVAFAFASSERNSKFRCQLDRRPLAGCRSPRAYAVRLGRHVFRVLAIDRAGNRDPSPALFRFRVRRR